MKEPQCTTRQECMRELAHVMDLAENAGLKWEGGLRLKGVLWNSYDSIPNFNEPAGWEFAVAIAYGEFIYIGDTGYSKSLKETVVVTGTKVGIGGDTLLCYAGVSGSCYTHDFLWEAQVDNEEWASSAATVMAQFISLTSHPDQSKWAVVANEAVRLLSIK